VPTTLWQFIGILVARWRVALGVLALVTLGAAAVNFLLPKRYTATASVLVDVKTPDPILGVLPGVMSPAYMATQVDIIESDRVGLQVVKRLKLDQNPAMQQQWRDATGGAG
jgi:uncharacterized protein involved in exopolysaccharide biosynthesis